MERLVRLSVAAICIGMAAPAGAHPVPFSFVDVRIQAASLDITVVAHIFDLGHDLGIEPPQRLLEPPVLSSEAEAITTLVRTRLHLSADGQPLTGGIWSAPQALPERQSIQLAARFNTGSPPGRIGVATVMFPYDPVHQTFVNFYERDAITVQAILDDRHADFDYFAGTRQGVRAVMERFAPEGARHILVGPEHLLFLVGLLLVGGSIGRLLLIVTAFTVAHSITLPLAALNIVTPSLRFVDPGIGLSIVYVGADNLMVRGGRDVRAWIAAAFGLLHGFGFAGVLRDMDLSRRALGWTVFSFNLGVEAGQLLVVLAVASALGALHAHSELAGRRLAFAGSIVVIAAGTYWFIQRVFFPGGMA
jgi:HupE/UreJ protein